MDLDTLDLVALQVHKADLVALALQAQLVLAVHKADLVVLALLVLLAQLVLMADLEVRVPLVHLALRARLEPPDLLAQQVRKAAWVCG